MRQQSTYVRAPCLEQGRSFFRRDSRTTVGGEEGMEESFSLGGLYRLLPYPASRVNWSGTECERNGCP